MYHGESSLCAGRCIGRVRLPTQEANRNTSPRPQRCPGYNLWGVGKAESLVKDAIDHGATLLCGSKGNTDHGFYFQPTILTGMKSNMWIADEEIFGPVLGLFKFETEDEVVELANNTVMGLASYAFTNDVNLLWRMLENLEAGMIGMGSQRSPSHYL
jgi:succinate-semialdehyde dehydrogenase/glutarate-semialdehyde dehydrogenase